MTMEELKNAIDKLKAEGETEEEMLSVFYGMYIEGDITLENLRTIIGVLGYEFTEEFEAMSEEDKKTKGWVKDDEPAKGVDKDEIEDAKEFGDEKDKDGKKPSADEEEDDDKKAARLFGFDSKKK